MSARLVLCLFVAGFATAASCVEVEPIASSEPASFMLRLIGSRNLPQQLVFGGTTVGGLSGIDYDPARDLYYLISDDKSVFAPTRFYTARLAIDATGFHDVALQTVVTLLRRDGTPYPSRESGEAADAESIRYDRATDSLWWTSEGARRLATARNVARLVDPFVKQSTRDGRYLGEVPLDPMFRSVAEARGPRDNRVFEGLTITPDGRSLWTSLEGPLIQDGDMPDAAHGAWSRFTRHERQDGGTFGPMTAQYAYRIDPVAMDGAWTARAALNGVSEILALDANRFLVLERGLVLGPHWRIRLYEADASAASDVHAIDALAGDSARFTPVAKRLVLDFDTLGIAIDNLEGICFGPTLPNGHRTLVLVADDNFSLGEASQFVAFEIFPRP